jgi:hypothetical protein
MVGGSAVFVGLPLLEAMLNSHGDAMAAGEPLAKYFLMWFWGNGNIPNRWNPATTGPGWTSEQTAPLDANPEVKKYISICTNFDSKSPQKITHHEGMAVFSGYPFSGWNGGLTSYAGGPTLDQVIADKIGTGTTFKSVQVGISKHLSQEDGGTTMHFLSHRSASEPLQAERNPNKLWTTLFGSFTPPQDPSKALRQNVVDAVRAQATELRNRVGTLDQQRLDAHLDGLNELEKKIQAVAPLCTPPVQPTETNTDQLGVEPLVSVGDAMDALMTYAFACDLTRSISMMVDGGAGLTVYKNINQSVAHHKNTHSWPSKQPEIHAAVLYHMQRLNHLLELMYNTPHGAGNLLDQSVVFASSDCSEGWTHSVDDQPMIVAGKGGGSLVYPGVHVKSPNGQNPSDVLLSILQAFDPTATSVGGGACASSTPLAAIKA